MKISVLDPFSVLHDAPLSFSITCKNSGRNYRYDLTPLSKSYLQITQAFACSIISGRSAVGHLTREKCLASIRLFYAYLDGLPSASRPSTPKEVSASVLRHFANWLRKSPDRSYNSSSILYRALCALINRWGTREWAPKNLVVPTGQFPGSNATAKARPPYSDDELNRIVDAVSASLSSSGVRLEQPYIPRYLNNPPPIDDVAPFNESLPLNLQHDKWRSRDYRVWWWENNCGCKRLAVGEIVKIAKGSTFVRSLACDWARKSSIRGASKLLEEFYEEIDAGDEYIPRYVGKESPIRYDNRWKKLEYLQWYWENFCNCSLEPYGVLKKKYPRFIGAVREHHGSLVKFYEFVGIQHQITAYDLVPYYLGLLISTALNPTTIQRLTIDCLSPDPIDPAKRSINWRKLRAGSEGLTIPAGRGGRLSPVRLVERVMKVTAPYRLKNQPFLFITNGANSGSKHSYHLTKTIFSRAVRAWFSDNGLAELGDSFRTDNQPTGHAVRFRTTVARNEYKRTGQIHYVQTLLGHRSAAMTSEYLSKLGNPVLQFRRGIHLQALVIQFTSSRENALNEVKKAGISSAQLRRIQAHGGPHETNIARCRKPLRSPVYGQRTGAPCNAQDYCLYCENLVVTEHDLVRHFAFVFYYNHMFHSKAISESEHEAIVGERRHMFDTYIIPRFDADLVNHSMEQARVSPPVEWKILE